MAPEYVIIDHGQCSTYFICKKKVSNGLGVQDYEYTQYVDNLIKAILHFYAKVWAPRVKLLFCCFF